MHKYSNFFWVFCRCGYISEPTKDRAGNRTFEIDFDSIHDTETAIQYFERENMRYVRGDLNKHRALVYID